MLVHQWKPFLTQVKHMIKYSGISSCSLGSTDSFTSVWYTPFVIWSHPFALRTFQHVDNKIKKNVRRHVRWISLERVLAQWWCPVASSKAMDLLQAMRAVLYRHTTTALIFDMASKGWRFFIIVCCLSPWQLPGRYRASSCPMVASRVIWCVPGHAALWDATCIASTRPHGHQNGLQRMYMCLLPSTFSFAVNVDEMQCYSQLKHNPIA